MIDIISQPAEIRRRLYDQIGLRLGLHPRSVEKDLWVTSVLQALFSLPYANAFVFKGGSSLSKVWSLISRFSEDVDIAVDRSLFGVEGDVTKKQLKKLRKESSLFVKENLAKDIVKNAVITCLAVFILFAGLTVEGKMHDKKIADTQYSFPYVCVLQQDTGYQGYAPDNVTILQPMKKPKGKELTQEQKASNTEISKTRITVEHAIGGAES